MAPLDGNFQVQVSAGSQLGGDKTPFSSSYSTNSTEEEQCRQGTDSARAAQSRERFMLDSTKGYQGKLPGRGGVKRSPGGPERWSWRGRMPQAQG